MNVSVSGGQLASIHSTDENAFVHRLATSTLNLSQVQTIWIGGTNTLQLEWRWSDGTKWDHAAWSPGEPNNWQNDEHCLSMYNAHGCHRETNES
jgi:hypothetical protein